MPKGYPHKNPFADCHPNRKHYSCGQCQTCYNKARPYNWRERNLYTKYRLYPRDYDKLIQDQSGKCALCRKFVAPKKFTVDHDHDTNRVRGLLCMGCNIALAGYEKLSMNPRLTRYLKYTEDHPKLQDNYDAT